MPRGETHGRAYSKQGEQSASTPGGLARGNSLFGRDEHGRIIRELGPPRGVEGNPTACPGIADPNKRRKAVRPSRAEFGGDRMLPAPPPPTSRAPLGGTRTVAPNLPRQCHPIPSGRSPARQIRGHTWEGGSSARASGGRPTRVGVGSAGNQWRNEREGKPRERTIQVSLGPSPVQRTLGRALNSDAFERWIQCPEVVSSTRAGMCYRRASP